MDAYFKGWVTLRLGARSLRFRVGHSLFASDRADAGTLLLLEHLPSGEPARFLDLGCGYGAVGLAVAQRFPQARGLLVDRDLLACRYARENAREQGAASVEVRPSLDYREVCDAEGPFDWVLSNVPARCGERALAAFIAGGVRRLRPGGELRIVAIEDLTDAVARAAARAQASVREVARGGNHRVFAFPRAEAPLEEGGDDVYARDTVRLALPEPLALARPTDLADEPHRLSAAVPFLAECLPAGAPARVLAFRCGYGLVPALALARYPRARVVAQDRDLLAVAYARANLAAAGDRARVEAEVDLAPLAPLGPYDLAIGELSPPAGRAATLDELRQLRALLAPGGAALVLARNKPWRDYLSGEAASLGLTRLGTRGEVVLLRLR